MASLIYLAFIFFSNKLIKKKKLFLSNTGFEHQSFINISTPLTGGVYLLFPAIYLFFVNHNLFIFTYIILFFLGLLSDLKILDSAKKRFFIQIIIVLSFTFVVQLEVTPTKIIFFDNMIENTYWSFIFTTFCLMILINGSNFIDGMTVMPPATTTFLFCMVFGQILGPRIGHVAGVPYINFIAPGLIMNTIVIESFNNLASSVLIENYHKLYNLNFSP